MIIFDFIFVVIYYITLYYVCEHYLQYMYVLSLNNNLKMICFMFLTTCALISPGLTYISFYISTRILLKNLSLKEFYEKGEIYYE